MENRVLILSGPTAVGKTEISLHLARLLNTDIISSDSMQIYKNMDIGTAKPSVQQRSKITHHMIDIVEPWEYFSTGDYIRKVRVIIKEILSNNKIPLIVGGTGLYLKAMTEGIFEGADADWKLRNKLIEKEKKIPGSLYQMLKEVDPQSASKINPHDLRRTIRALEVFLKENKTISDFQKNLTKPLGYNFFKIIISRERKEIYQRIEKRLDTMIQQGLIEETRKVLSFIKRHYKNDNTPLPSLQAIGYKEIAGYLSDLYCLDEAIRLIKKRTKNYAKRQFTWLKKEKEALWFDITGRDDYDKITEEIFKKIAYIFGLNNA
jgi:tRNA dimethylallyltransferase